jgi:hypothetical protein
MIRRTGFRIVLGRSPQSSCRIQIGQYCNRPVIFRKIWKIFAGADFEQNIANRVGYLDIHLAEKARNFTHDIAVSDNRLQNEFGHPEVEFRCVGVKGDDA